jgi:hypothetical protein
MTEPRTIKTKTRIRQKDGTTAEREITFRLCDVEGCDDLGSRWHYPGNRAFCAEHRHLGEADGERS